VTSFSASLTESRQPRRRIRAAWLLLALAIIGLAVTGCFPKRTTYPIEIFTEMHYTQSYRMQEPPRLNAVDGAEVYVQLSTADTLTVPDRLERPYTPASGAELYRVNCAVCHGADGSGNGSIVPYLTDGNSYYAKSPDGTSRDPYPSPPSLIESRSKLTEDGMVGIVSTGIIVMPKFSLLLSEEDIREIVAYVYDEANGLGRR
jgi:mono/diheme cytochrome c family protein